MNEIKAGVTTPEIDEFKDYLVHLYAEEQQRASYSQHHKDRAALVWQILVEYNRQHGS